MSRFRAVAVPLLALIAPSAAADPEPASAGLHAIFDEYWEYTMQRNPTWATYLGDHRGGDRLQDLSEAAELAHVDSLRVYRERVRAIDRSRLDAVDRLSAEVFVRALERDVEGAAFRGYLVPMSQQSGPHIGFPQIIESQPFDTVELCDDYIVRLGAFPAQIEQIVGNMRRGIAEGIVAHRGAIEKALPQVRSLGEGDPAAHPLADVEDRLGETIEPAEKDRILVAIGIAVEERVMPAYRDLGRFLKEEYLPACRDVPGIHVLPRGREWYAYRVRRYTTTDLSPREIHELGRREMERIRAEMDGVRRAVEFEGDLPAFIRHLREDPVFYHDSKETLMEEYRVILDAMDEKLPDLFGRLPESPYDLKEIESYRAEAAPAAYYYGPPDDGSRPGYFYVNTYDLPSRPRYTMAALAYHEAVPGHHLQIAIQQELDLPDFRRHGGFTAFVEGWGLYAERLAGEVGGYVDPYADFGRLTFEAWRAARLVVDTGLHEFGWSRQQAIDYLLEATPLARHDVESEVDRYIAWPGQALAYKIGELEIRELRRQAETALGDRFDLRAFHDALLENGALPLDLLRERLGRWQEEVKASARSD